MPDRDAIAITDGEQSVRFLGPSMERAGPRVDEARPVPTRTALHEFVARRVPGGIRRERRVPRVARARLLCVRQGRQRRRRRLSSSRRRRHDGDGTDRFPDGILRMELRRYRDREARRVEERDAREVIRQ